MKKIILDTNFLLIPALFKVDIFLEIKNIVSSKYQLYIIDRTVDELKNIMKNKKQSGKDKAAAKLALSIIPRFRIKKLKSEKEEHVDNAIVRLSAKSTTIVSTQDTALKRRLRERQIPIITLRQKRYLVLQD